MIRQLNQLRWALARLAFFIYIGFSVVSLVGGFLSAPLMTWYFFGDWRFWRHWSAGLGLWPHAIRILRLIASDSQGFMFSVPLTSPPRTIPDLAATTLQPFWPHGASCGDCSNCCRPGGSACPLLDQEKGLCRGYDSFYWRYFNCGRFPSDSSEIDYYGCRKWVLEPAFAFVDQPGGGTQIAYTVEQAENRDSTAGEGVAEDAHRWHAAAHAKADAETDLGGEVLPMPSKQTGSGLYEKGGQRYS